MQELPKYLTDKIEKAISDKHIVGNTIFTEEEYVLMLDYTRYYSRAFILSPISIFKGDRDIVFITLVEIAKRWKDYSNQSDDKGFWVYVFNIIIGYDSNQKLYGAFVDIIKDISVIIPSISEGKKYYATIMMHALSPQQSIFDFFNLAYNIFRKELDFSYTSIDKDICEIATESFCSVIKNYGSRDVPISVGSSSYGIKIGLRGMALCDDTRNIFVGLLDQALCCINELYHKGVTYGTTFFDEMAREWWKNKQEKDLSRVSTTRVCKEEVVGKKNVIVKFVRENESVFLYMPAIRVVNSQNTKLVLTIMHNEAECVNEELRTRIGELTMTSAPYKINLNEIVKQGTKIDIRVRLTENDEVLLDKHFEKDFILFEDTNETDRSVLKVGNYFIYTRCIDELQTPIDISTVSDSVYNIYPRLGETLCGKKNRVYFVEDIAISSGNSVTLFGLMDDCEWEYFGKRCKIFENFACLIVPRSMSANSIRVSVNKSQRLLSELSSRVEEQFLIYDISKLFPIQSQFEFAIYSHAKDKYLITPFDAIVFSDFSIVYDSPIFYGEKSGITINYNKQNISFKCDNTDEVCCPLDGGKLFINPPFLRWRIDNGMWNNSPYEKCIWYKDPQFAFHNGSLLEIATKYDVDSVELYCECNGTNEKVTKSNIRGCFAIGRYLYSKEGREKLTFFLRVKEYAQPLKVFTVATKEYFPYYPLEVIDEKVCFVGAQHFIGEGTRNFKLSFTKIGSREIIIESQSLSENIISELDEGIYWVVISSEQKGLFVSSNPVFWKGEFVFGNKETLQLRNIVLKINPIWGFKGLSGDYWKYSVEGYYLSNLQRDELDDKSYYASVYYLNARGDRQNIEDVKKIKINISSPIALSITVPDEAGDYTLKLKYDGVCTLMSPKADVSTCITNYHYIEVKNV